MPRYITPVFVRPNGVCLPGMLDDEDQIIEAHFPHAEEVIFEPGYNKHTKPSGPADWIPPRALVTVEKEVKYRGWTKDPNFTEEEEAMLRAKRKQKFGQRLAHAAHVVGDVAQSVAKVAVAVAAVGAAAKELKK